MTQLSQISAMLRTDFEQINEVREKSIALARVLTRTCSNAIRTIHRMEWESAELQLAEVRQTAQNLQNLLANHPDLYYSGNTQDALKEYVEAFLTYRLVQGEALMTPQDLNVISSTYINGLAEAASELRRQILDRLRKGDFAEAERMLESMDQVYVELMSMGYPDAITGGLRHRTDALRAVLERTRGDLTLSLQQHQLQQALNHLAERLDTAV